MRVVWSQELVLPEVGGSPVTTGLVHVYTGLGKGKTTAALGLAVRALGHGLRVYCGQFMKGVPYGELSTLEKLPNVTLRQFGAARWTYPNEATPEDRILAWKGFEASTAAVLGGEYDLVILDEINVAVAWGLLPVMSVVDLIVDKPASVELVLTGRYAPPGAYRHGGSCDRNARSEAPVQVRNHVSPGCRILADWSCGSGMRSVRAIQSQVVARSTRVPSRTSQPVVASC